jgi:hypothetical protein
VRQAQKYVNAGCHVVCIRGVAVDEYEVDRAGDLLDELPGVANLSGDPLLEPGLAEIGLRAPGDPGVDFEILF